MKAGSESEDLYDDPRFRDWVKRVERGLVPKIDDSSVVVSLIPEGAIDIKFAVELGLSIMMDKPIIALIRPGIKIPSKLALIADRIIEGGVSTEADRAKIHQAIMEMNEKLDAEDG